MSVVVPSEWEHCAATQQEPYYRETRPIKQGLRLARVITSTWCQLGNAPFIWSRLRP